MGPTVAILQARLGSNRLPRKVLADIHGKPMIWWMLQRIYNCTSIDCLIVATTDKMQDDELEKWVQENTKLPVFRGSADDLVKRYYDCAKEYNAETIVRLTADDPLKDADIIDKAVDIFNSGSYDYVSNCIHPTYPEGLDVEVFSISALARVFNESILCSDREHLTTFMQNNPKNFKLQNFEFEEDLSSWRWTVDKQIDLDFVRLIFKEFYNNPKVDFKTVIEFLKKYPELIKMNQNTVRMEGYKNSVLNEGKPND